MTEAAPADYLLGSAASRLTVSIDVVLVAYQRWDLTESCLRHLAKQTVAHSVILTDNGSTDGTADAVHKSFPDVRVIRLEDNMPYAVACNRAVEAGRGDVIVTINNDVDCRPDFLARLVAPFEEDERIASVSALLLKPGEETIDTFGLVADRTLAAFPRFYGRPVAEAHPTRPTLTGPAGAAAAYRRTAWEEVGALDETMFAYMEDVDLALRLRAAGWKAVAAPGAVAVHIGAATHGHRSRWQRWHLGFGRGYLLRRYGVLRSRAALRAVTTEGIVVIGDAVLERDVASARGRFSGWRAAAGKPRRSLPPKEAIGTEISFLDSIRMRLGGYSGRGVASTLFDNAS